MADTTISQLTQANPSPGHLLPYSTGNNTLATPVSAIFQNFELASRLGIGTTNPIRQLHLATTGESYEQIWEQLNGVPNYRKWNLVINNNNNSPGVKSSITLRQLNDAGLGGNIVWSYDANLSAHNVNGNINNNGIPFFGVRAWVCFDPQRDSTGATNLNNTPRFIKASGNVSSVLRNSTGNWTASFITNMPHANYAVSMTTRDNNDDVGVEYAGIFRTNIKSVSQFQWVAVYPPAGVLFDGFEGTLTVVC